MSRRTHLVHIEKHEVAPVHTLRVEPLVWREALRLALGDHHRIQVEGEDSVVVLNHASLVRQKH